jgi:hypothetical protein
MNAKLKGFSEEVDLETQQSQHYLVFETDTGKKFSIPVPEETTKALIQEMIDSDVHPEPAEEEASQEVEAEEEEESDFDEPPPPAPPPQATPKMKLRPPLRKPSKKPVDELEIDPEDAPEGATFFGGDDAQPAPFELHETSTQKPKMTEEKVPGL